MLVQFSMKNVLSFKDETVLDMTSIPSYKEHEENLVEVSDNYKDKLVRVSTIYGANASVKSNLCIGMRLFQKIIVESLNNVGDNEDIAIKKYYNPFSFEDLHKNSEYQIVVIIDEFEYKYGFEYNSNSITAEWLYRKNLNTNRKSTIFERARENVKFGASVRNYCEAFKDQIPLETLVLSFFNKLKLKTEIFKQVYFSIIDISVVPTDFCEDKRVLQILLPDIINNNKDELLEFLIAIDTGIKDINYDDSGEKIEFTTVHKGENGKDYPLGLFFESEGTIKCILLFIYIRKAIINNKSIFVDDLNIKLHPLLLKFIINLLHNRNSKAQLIYTTHDTTLLDTKFFRRDQIWFVQKDEFGCSQLSALSDFKVRSDASFEKDYLAGVYGGIPFLKEYEWRKVE